MARIFDNIDTLFLPALEQALDVAERADFCVGYFNLRGWQLLDARVEAFAGGEEHCCRLIVGMQKPPADFLRDALIEGEGPPLDNARVIRLKREVLKDFRDQLMMGIPSSRDEAALHRLIRQLLNPNRKLTVKLYLRRQLHAKLYLLHAPIPQQPVGFVGSSNLTFAGLSRQAELNLDVVDPADTDRLAEWFNDRWNDDRCYDITDDLIAILEESWARSVMLPPYHIYVKMAWHLCSEALEGIREFRLPPGLNEELFEFQKKAVQIAARHVHKHGGVILADVVGLGKTLMATALARVLEDQGMDALIICPPNLVAMWQDYRTRYGLRGDVLSSGSVQQKLLGMIRYRLVILDESHNLRNREGARYATILQYLRRNESRCVLLSATPYNKTYLDLANQLRLFVPEDQPLNVRPTRLIKEMGGEVEFEREHQCQPNTLAAFEKSEHPEDWRELMTLHMIRRTRSFIIRHYSETNPDTGRPCLVFQDGTRRDFPERVPKTVQFFISDSDQYGRLYSKGVVDVLNALSLPRYGLGLPDYLATHPSPPPTQKEELLLGALSRAGKRLKGFCRTNLFKRLESSGHSFLLSLERHALRNFVFLHALENGLPLPIGAQNADLLDTANDDEDSDDTNAQTEFGDGDGSGMENGGNTPSHLRTEPEFRARAAEVYALYKGPFKKRFKWIASHLFTPSLADGLLADALALLKMLKKSGAWVAGDDTKLVALHALLAETHPRAKVLVFSQFADTVRYVARELKARGVNRLAAATGNSSDPTALAHQFSPVSNRKRDAIKPADELRVLIATDVLSEGQNLQDCHIIVNYDLPWAIIRLIQRAGRVDRIGQAAPKILCHTFLPADGVERIIDLRGRLVRRLGQNAEVVGTDEHFFEGDENCERLLDLYHEKSGLLDGEGDEEIDLVSHAYQIWQDAIQENPELEKSIPLLPNVVYSAKGEPPPAPGARALIAPHRGALVFTRTGEGNDVLAWMGDDGQPVTDSPFAILDAAACRPDTPAVARAENHHALVEQAVRTTAKEARHPGGSLGSPRGPRFRAYDALKSFLDRNDEHSLFGQKDIRKDVELAQQEILKWPLRPVAANMIRSHLRLGAPLEAIAEVVIELYRKGELCQTRDEEPENAPPQLICSLGLRPAQTP